MRTTSVGRRNGQSYRHRTRWESFESLGIGLQPDATANEAGSNQSYPAHQGEAAFDESPPAKERVVVPTPGPEKVDSANSNAIQFIMQEKLKTKPANAYLAERQKEQQQQPFKFQQHFGFDIIEDELVLAGTLADPKDCAGYAQLLQQDACDRLCSGNKSCTRRCRIGCYLQRAGITYFYHGSTREVVDAFTTEFASAVFTHDELTLRSMRAVDIFPDRAMELTDLDRFKMRAVALKSAPGAVAYVADVAAWCTLCLESPDVPVSEVELEPRYKQILVDQEPVLGPPHTSEWQRVYEQRVYGGLQVNEFLHGVLVAVDGMDLKCLATRKLKPGYALPEAFRLLFGEIPNGGSRFSLLQQYMARLS